MLFGPEGSLSTQLRLADAAAASTARVVVFRVGRAPTNSFDTTE